MIYLAWGLRQPCRDVAAGTGALYCHGAIARRFGWGRRRSGRRFPGPHHTSSQPNRHTQPTIELKGGGGPFFVRALDVGRTTDDGQWVVVMEYLEHDAEAIDLDEPSNLYNLLYQVGGFVYLFCSWDQLGVDLTHHPRRPHQKPTTAIDNNHSSHPSIQHPTKTITTNIGPPKKQNTKTNRWRTGWSSCGAPPTSSTSTSGALCGFAFSFI